MEHTNQHFSPRKKAMLTALESSLGIVTTAAKQAGINRSTHRNWMRSDPAYAEAAREIEDIALDFSESHLMSQIRAGNITAIIFFLKCKGKRRGYVERQELTGADGRDLGLAPVIETKEQIAEEAARHGITLDELYGIAKG